MAREGAVYVKNSTEWIRKGRPNWNAPVPAVPAPNTNPRTTLVYGDYKPSAANTGNLAGISLTPFNTGGADLIVSADGTIFRNLDIFGDIKVQASGVRFENCRIRGGLGTPVVRTGCINAMDPRCVGLVVQDCLIQPDRPHRCRDGIYGQKYTVERCNITRCNDGVSGYNLPPATAADIKVYGNFIHELTYWFPDSNTAHNDGTHNDGIQIEGGTGVHIKGNTVVASAVAGTGTGTNPTLPDHLPHSNGVGVLVQNNTGTQLTGLIIEKNWLDDGLASLRIRPSTTMIVVQNNVFGRNQYPYSPTSKYTIRVDSKVNTVLTFTNNTFEDNGAVLTEGKATGIRYDDNDI